LLAAMLLIYCLAVFVDSTSQNKSAYVGLLSIITALELLMAYGLGVWRNIFVRMILKRGADSKKSVELKK